MGLDRTSEKGREKKEERKRNEEKILILLQDFQDLPVEGGRGLKEGSWWGIGFFCCCFFLLQKWALDKSEE